MRQNSGEGGPEMTVDKALLAHAGERVRSHAPIRRHPDALPPRPTAHFHRTAAARVRTGDKSGGVPRPQRGPGGPGPSGVGRCEARPRPPPHDADPPAVLRHASSAVPHRHRRVWPGGPGDHLRAPRRRGAPPRGMCLPRTAPTPPPPSPRDRLASHEGWGGVAGQVRGHSPFDVSGRGPSAGPRARGDPAGHSVSQRRSARARHHRPLPRRRAAPHARPFRRSGRGRGSSGARPEGRGSRRRT